MSALKFMKAPQELSTYSNLETFFSKKISSLETKLFENLSRLQNLSVNLENLDRQINNFFDIYYSKSVDIKNSMFDKKILLEEIYQLLNQTLQSDIQTSKLTSVNNYFDNNNLKILNFLNYIENFLSRTSSLEKIIHLEEHCQNLINRIKNNYQDVYNTDIKRQIIWFTVCCEDFFNEIDLALQQLLQTSFGFSK